MRYPHIYHAVHFQPWLIMPAWHAAIASILQSRISDIQLDQYEKEVSSARENTFASARPALAIAGEPISGSSPFAKATLDTEGIATIPVTGIIAKGASAFEKACYGGVGPEDIAQSLDAVTKRADVRGILMYFDTPGGTVAGVPEVADQIASIQQEGRQEIFSYTDSLQASAGYWLGAGANRMYATRLATVGSIGVYMPWLDRTEEFKKAGVTVDLIKDGKYKGAGYPGTKLSEADRERFQQEVYKIGDAFRSHVRTYRGRVKRESMEGQAMLATDAADAGLIDGIVASMADVKKRFKQPIS